MTVAARLVMMWCLAALLALPTSAISQAVCGIGQHACGTVCFDPSLGQHCDGGVVCAVGQHACGRWCYTPSMGQHCDAGMVCGVGQVACGRTCITPSMGQHCDQGVNCGPGQLACGRSCYTPSLGQHCDNPAASQKGVPKGHPGHVDGQPYPGRVRK